MIGTKLTEIPRQGKKELLQKISELEKELYLYKNRTQLARNYNILKKENKDLQEKLSQVK
jgi:uncharacterized protein involved in exopolysaccharide biosynthesis